MLCTQQRSLELLGGPGIVFDLHLYDITFSLNALPSDTTLGVRALYSYFREWLSNKVNLSKHGEIGSLRITPCVFLTYCSSIKKFSGIDITFDDCVVFSTDIADCAFGEMVERLESLWNEL